MTMCDTPELLRLSTPWHNRKPNRIDETQRNLWLPDVQMLLPVSRACSKICLICQRLGSGSSRLQHTFLWDFPPFIKGWRQQRLSSPLSQIKREHTQAGLDSHLKTLYSLTLVLLFSLSFSQSKGLASSQHVIYLPFGLPVPNRNRLQAVLFWDGCDHDPAV